MAFGNAGGHGPSTLADSDAPPAPRRDGVVIAGAGALGSLYGGLLAASGVNVSLIARGEHARVMRERGLELRLPMRSLVVPVEVVTEASGEILILSAKLFDTDAALGCVNGSPRIAVSFQNGPRKNEALLHRFGRDAVVLGASMITAELAAPGIVMCHNLGSTYVGPSSSLAAELAGLFARAGLDSHVVDDIASLEWSKLAFASALMLLQLFTGRPSHEILSSSDTANVLRDLVRELDEIADAEGVRLADWPNLPPVRSIASAPETEAIELVQRAGHNLALAGSGSLFTSMYQSVSRGRRTELDEIHGELVRIASRHGIAAPLLTSCYRIARSIAQEVERPNP